MTKSTKRKPTQKPKRQISKPDDIVRKTEGDVTIPESLRKPVARMEGAVGCEFCGAHGPMPRHYATCPTQARSWSYGASMMAEVGSATSAIASHRIDKAIEPSRFWLGFGFGMMGMGVLCAVVAAAVYFS